MSYQIDKRRITLRSYARSLVLLQTGGEGQDSYAIRGVSLSFLGILIQALEMMFEVQWQIEVPEQQFFMHAVVSLG
jgi:hypothetical protein